PLPQRVECFARLCLDTHTTRIDSQHSGDVFAHGVDVSPEFWRLEQDCRVDVDYVEIAFAHQPHHTRKQIKTIGATQLWILVGKMHAYIAFTKRTENRIGNSMSERVGIGMSFGAAIASDVHTAEHKLPSLYESMGVSADTNTKHIVFSIRVIRG